MRETLGSIIGSWARKALIVGALLAAPVLAPAQAAPVHGLRAEAPATAEAQTVQYYDRGRGYGRGYYGERRWRGPPPGYYNGRRAYRYGPPPRRYYAYRPYRRYYR